MATPDPRPYLVLTVVLDGAARLAAVTRSHGDAMERAYKASTGRQTAGLDIVELPVAPPAFAAMRRTLTFPPTTVAMYDIFPLAAHLDADTRRIAGQFLAAEALWGLEEQGMLGSVPLNLRLDLPRGWNKDPKDIRERLVQAGALDLSAEAIETFKVVKETWDALGATKS